MTETLWSQLDAIWAEIADLEHVIEVLGWDQQVNLPPGAAAGRGEQIATLESLAHARLCSPALADLLAGAEAVAEMSPERRAWLRAARRRQERATRLPAELVVEMSRAASAGFSVWQEARRDDDFRRYAPALERNLRLARQYADALGGPSRYAALLQVHEPEMDLGRVDQVFTELRAALPPLVDRVLAGRPLSRAPFDHRVDPERQLAAGRAAITHFGYDWNRGREDLSAHPFSVSFGADDCRITTRIDPDDFASAFFATLHEAGHALYEQGLPAAWSRTPLGQACSTAVHESQSRLWENVVGRSLPFWEFFAPELAAAIPEPFARYGADDMFRAANVVRRSLIRVEADELTYNLHVLLRFELERAMVAGDLGVADLPAAWADGMQRLVGIRPDTDREGVLQDVHWSQGGFGYFPTYTLGTVMAAQWLTVAERVLPDLWSEVRAGDFSGLLGFLRREIHARAATVTPDELVRAVTGGPLDCGPYLAYLREKYEALA